MYVKDVRDGVCGFYTTLYTEYCYSSHSVEGVEDAKYYCILYTGPLTPLGEGISCAFCPVGLAVHHQSVRGSSSVNFLGLVNYKGDCRQDTQPIPNS